MSDMSIEQIEELAESMENISIYEFIYLSAAANIERISGKFVFDGRYLHGISKQGIAAVLGKDLFLHNFAFPFSEVGGRLYHAGLVDYDDSGVFITEKGKQAYKAYVEGIGDSYIGASLDGEDSPKYVVNQLITDIREKALELYLLLSLRGALKRSPKTKRLVADAERENGTIFFPMALDRVPAREDAILLGEENVGGMNGESFAKLLDSQTGGPYDLLRGFRSEDTTVEE